MKIAVLEYSTMKLLESFFIKKDKSIEQYFFSNWRKILAFNAILKSVILVHKHTANVKL